MSSRKRSISYKIASLLLLPVLSMLALSALAASHALGQGRLVLDATASALGVLAVAASIVIAVLVTRGIVREARGLTAGVYDFHNRRLPLIAERVRQGIATHGSFDAPDYHFTTKDIEKLYDAFIGARDAAIQATSDEATIRRGVGEVFVNLARRSQALVHRQLSLLDGMERRAAEPEELEDLFRLDHLATRMRRHAEGLVILSGRAPARGWRNPVPFIDVARGAVAEVEDYTRVTVTPMPGTALAGRAVADIIHLLAELIENAASFSPPHTSVLVSGQVVGNGFAIEIEDRGLGMAPERLNSINRMFTDPPRFDLSESAQLGLFVVGHLAKRQGLRVSMRPSPYGGTTAIILVPSELVVDGDATTFSREPVQEPVHEPAQVLVGAAAAGEATPQPSAATAGTETAANHLPGAPPATGDLPSVSAESERDAGWHGTHTNPQRTQGRHAQGDQPREQNAEDRPAEAELPRRVRQESLAPQLRETPAEPSGDAPSGHGASGAADADRSPDDVRATMAALQNGWLRGRSEGSTETEGAARSSGQKARPAKGEDA